ncbi:MAG: hypothetical protein JWO89_2368 [Verrucomicrobiaceae bacterium]|nr:hypothetical protein [Verrucomicrobiaceae bacterium]
MKSLLPLIALCFTMPALAEVPVVADGKALAVIVTADHPGQVAKYAAEELAEHLQKATGVRLAIVTESTVPPAVEGRIFLGECAASREAGLHAGEMAAEAFALKTKGKSLIITGNDGGGDPLDSSTRAGTLWGVYEWLDRELHVRWLWPGETGTYVPKTATVTAHDVDETTPPRFIQRKLRPGLGFESEHPALGFTKEAAEQYAHDQTVFLRRHRMGRSYPMGYGHAFVDWWKKDGKEHPEWFQLRDNGKRGPSKATGRFSMCVSSPGLQQEIVNRWAAKKGKATGGPSFVNACENDILGQCTCDQCRAWDGVPPADYLKYYSPSSKMTGSRFVSDRYAHFWLSVQQQAAKVDPKAVVIGYV